MKKVSKGLIIFCVIVPVISFIIGFCIALNIESKYRTIFSAERSGYKAKYDENYKLQQERANKTYLELTLLLWNNNDWKRYKNNMLDAYDIADDEYWLIGDMEKEWLVDFVRNHFDRNSKEKKLLRKYEREVPEFKILDSDVYPFPLQNFNNYKVSLRPKTLFSGYKPYESASIIGVITLAICVLAGFIYSVIKQNKT